MIIDLNIIIILRQVFPEREISHLHNSHEKKGVKDVIKIFKNLTLNIAETIMTPNPLKRKMTARVQKARVLII